MIQKWHGKEQDMAMLRVIDAASHQGNMNQGAMEFDALIVKATEGTGYVNPYCDSEFQEGLRLGKKLGVYHFARNTKNGAEAEAAYFVEHTKGYIGKAVPVLDWEDGNTGDVGWAFRWLQLVEKAYGCKPMIYMSESVVNRHDWSQVAAGDYGLWCAKYADHVPDYNWNMAGAGAPPSVKWWKTVALWQWTSTGRIEGYGGNLDCSIFYGDAAAWDKYVGNSSSGNEPVVPTPPQQEGRLRVDGMCGPDTVGLWQQVLHCAIIDRVISGQLVPDQKTYARPALMDSCVTYGGQGSALIRNVQGVLKKAGMYTGGMDGLLGPKTIDGLHRYLGVATENMRPWTSFGAGLVRALQTRLNTGQF